MEATIRERLHPKLQDYAGKLLEAGFKVYASKVTKRTQEFFAYSQEVEGQTCFGYVQLELFGRLSHSMPIRPTREYGSSMFISKSPLIPPDAVEHADAIARPRNCNEFIGCHDNAGSIPDYYVELTA